MHAKLIYSTNSRLQPLLLLALGVSLGVILLPLCLLLCRLGGLVRLLVSKLLRLSCVMFGKLVLLLRSLRRRLGLGLMACRLRGLLQSLFSLLVLALSLAWMTDLRNGYRVGDLIARHRFLGVMVCDMSLEFLVTGVLPNHNAIGACRVGVVGGGLREVALLVPHRRVEDDLALLAPRRVVGVVVTEPRAFDVG